MVRQWVVGLLLLVGVGCASVGEDVTVPTSVPVAVTVAVAVESDNVAVEPALVATDIVPTVEAVATVVPTAVPEVAAAPKSVIPADILVLYEEEIVFPEGATEGAVSRELPLDEAHRYVLYAFEGQRVDVSLTAETEFLSDFSVILAPLEGGAIGIGLSQLSFVDEKPVLSVVLPETGHYGLVLLPPDDWPEAVIYQLTVAISALDEVVEGDGESAVLHGYRFAESIDIGSYHIELFNDPLFASGGGRAMIFHRGTLVEQIAFATDLNPLSGQDVTLSGVPNLIVQTFSGGAHCCFGTFVYELGKVLTPILEIPFSECGGTFADLNGDGRYEYQTCDDAFAYRYCSYVASPFPSVVMGFDGERYMPVSADYVDLYGDEIASGEARARSSEKTEVGWDGTYKCDVLPAVLSYLYSGQGEAGRKLFNETYTELDREIFWAEMMLVLGQSVLYEAPADLPLIILPDSYRLEHGYDCGIDEGIVRVMAVGEPLCGEPLAVRDIFWLSAGLSEAGLLPETYYFQYAEDCVTACPILVVSFVGGEQVDVASVELKSTDDGYGYVVYVDQAGQQSQFRLRGDMGWERVE